jgi:hypothetical protein
MCNQEGWGPFGTLVTHPPDHSPAFASLSPPTSAFLRSLPTFAPLLFAPASAFWSPSFFRASLERLLVKCVPGRRMIDWIEAWRRAPWLRREHFMFMHLGRAQHVAMHEEGEAARLYQIRKVHCGSQRWWPWRKQRACLQLRSDLIYYRPSLGVAVGPGLTLCHDCRCASPGVRSCRLAPSLTSSKCRGSSPLLLFQILCCLLSSPCLSAFYFLYL